MALNLHLVRIFVAVADARSFTRAAEQLHISQPAVSKAIQELERQVGTTLLERGMGGVRPTEAGMILLRHAYTLFAAERAAEEELAALADLHSGTLHVGASTTIATYLLPAILGAFRARYAQIELTLTSGNTHEIAELMGNYQLDVALVEGPVDDPRIEVLPWRSDELGVIAPPDHPLAIRPVWARELAEYTMIVREPGSGTREVAEHALQTHGLELKRTLELGSTEAIKQAVIAGLGLSIVGRSAIADQLQLGLLCVLDMQDLLIRRDLNELVRVGRVPSAAVRALGPFLRPS
jgi:DNA-binding transcriptional LysR family regulator